MLLAVVASALALGTGCRSLPAPTPPEVRPVHETAGSSPTAARIVTSARLVLGAPYRYGGADRRGFD